MVSLGLGNLKSGLKFIAPLIAGGVAGELIMGKIPVEKYTQAIPMVKDLPGAIQRFIPALAITIVILMVFKTSDIAGGKWTIMSLLGGASAGIAVNLWAKGIQKGQGGAI